MPSRRPPTARRTELLLIEHASSPFCGRIAQAARDMHFQVHRVDGPERPAEGAVVGIGPSVSNPVQVARDIRELGRPSLLVFFAATSGARDAIQAELIRDPYISERYELIELTGDKDQLARRMEQAGTRVQRTTGPSAPLHRVTPRPRASRESSRPSGDEYLSSVLSHDNQAILSTDASGTIQNWNDAAVELFGFASRAATGQSVSFLHPELESYVGQTMATGKPAQASLTCRRASGESIDLEISVAAIANRRGQRVGATVIARPDSARELEEALREANRQKDEFLAIMSHELRTPLTSILGYTDMLLRGLGGELAPRTSRYITNVRSAGDRLLDLVNGLLDFTRLESGAERLEPAPLDLAAVVQYVVDKCGVAAQAKGIAISVDRAADSTEVCADETKLQHVLRNYVGNAIKFTPEGGSIAVRICVDPDQPDRLRVEVSDSGIGLRDEQLAHVWERFYQGDASLTRPYGGMGLGLAIARHLVLLHGGEVGAESTGPGRGSTFWFNLPR